MPLCALLVGGLVSLVPAAPALAVDFAATPIATPTNVPDSTVVGDFNSDGQLDLATASSSDGVSPVTALVRLDGGFVPHPISMRGTTVDDVIAADLDADGDTDLATADRWDGTVTIHLSNRDGTFVSRVAGSVIGGYAHSVAAGDLNADGRADLAATGSNAPGITALMRQADGSYVTSLIPGSGNRPYRVEIGDVDGDARADLAVNNADDREVTVLFSEEDGTFHAAAPVGTGRGAYEMAAGDLDGDGRTELVTADQGSNSVTRVSATDGRTLSATRIPVVLPGSNPAAVAIADVTGDRRPDIAVAGLGVGHDAVVVQRPGGAFTAPFIVGRTNSGFSIATGDVSGDGAVDLAVGGANDDSVNLLLNPGDTTAPTTTDDLPGAFTTAPQTVTLAAADDRWGVAETKYLAGVDPADPSDPANHPLTYDPAHRPVLDEGERIRYFSTDLAGNAEAVRTVAATVDRTAPTTTDDVPAAEQDAPVTVTLDATDAGAGVAAIRYLAGTDPADPTDPANAPLTYDPAHTPVLAPGERIRYSAVDALGNTETAKTSAIVLARTPAPTPDPQPTPDPTPPDDPTPDPAPPHHPAPTPDPAPDPLAPARPCAARAADHRGGTPTATRALRLPRTIIHLAATPTRATLLARGLRVSQVVPGARRVTWTLTIAGGPTLGRRTLTTRGASTATGRIRVTSASGRRALRTHRRTTLVLTTTFVAADGARHTATRRLAITAAGRVRIAR